MVLNFFNNCLAFVGPIFGKDSNIYDFCSFLVLGILECRDISVLGFICCLARVIRYFAVSL